MLLATVVVAGSTFFYTRYARGQLDAMQGQLQEMRRSGQSATDQMWQAIGNLNWQAQSTQGALNLTRDQFRMDQRPYIWVTGNLGTPDWTAMRGSTNLATDLGQVLWTVHYTNYGRTPARELSTEKLISVGEEAYRHSFRGEDAPPAAHSAGVPMPPTKEDFVTIVSEPLRIARRDWLWITSPEYFGPNPSIKLIFRYTDAYGAHYETGVCLNRTNAGSISYCAHGNYIR
jgi:hypothetical protein